MSASPRWFRPLGFLAGFAAALVACSVVARLVSSGGFHAEFTRFHVRLSPEAHYYPTIEEMRGIVRDRARPDQILVIVGGNSIFHGVGQPAGKLWTEELQRRLGPRYAVLNFAFRGALCTDGGAFVAESLRAEYPRQIYVANTSPFVPPHPIGQDPYRYLFWEARTRGLLEDFGPRDEQVAAFLRVHVPWGTQVETLGLNWLDRALRFRDLWTWVGYDKFFTIQNAHTPTRPQATWPRRLFRDEEGDFEQIPVSRRYPPAGLEAEMAIVRGFSSTYCERGPDGAWRVIPSKRAVFDEVARAAFPDSLKSRTLILLSRNSPYYLSRLTPEEREREEFCYREGVQAWRRLGYSSLDYGADFAPEHFGDRTHLTATGGRRLAGIVAAEVESISARLGYLDALPPSR